MFVFDTIVDSSPRWLGVVRELPTHVENLQKVYIVLSKGIS
jgi:hypothetical protein